MQSTQQAPDPSDSIARPAGTPSPPIHSVQFYETETELLNELARFVGVGLADGGASCLVIATAPHRNQLTQRLCADGFSSNILAKNLVTYDAAETLAKCLHHGRPDAERFAATIEPLLAAAAIDGRPMYVFGEMVALLAQTNPHAGIELEALWNDLLQRRQFRLMCAYPVDQIDGPAGADLLHHVITAHDGIIPSESFSTLATDTDRQRAIVTLQQKARWLTAEIARRKQAEADLQAALAAEQQARREAEAALAAREDFLAIAAHELRTPLTGLSAQIQLLQRRLARGQQPDTERLARTLAVANRQASKIAQLIDRLLNASRLKAGTLILHRHTVDLSALAEQTVRFWQATSDQTQMHWTIEPGLVIEGDGVRLEQVLGNLLNNAIKFGPRHNTVDVSLAAISPHAVELTVQDQGPGIAPAARGHLFEQFFHADCDDATRGLGLGLYVTRQIVELHGGAIRAEFPPEGGSRFVVCLPMNDSAQRRGYRHLDGDRPNDPINE